MRRRRGLIYQSINLSARAIKVVIVDVQLRVGIGSTGLNEGDIDKALTQHLVEDGVSERAVLLKHLVHDIPGVDFALITARNLDDVVLDDVGELRLVLDVLDPLRELRVPDEGVAADELVAAGGPVGDGIGVAPVETALRS